MGNGVLDAVCVLFRRLFRSLCAVVGEGVCTKFGIRVHTEDLSTYVHFDLCSHVFCFLHDGCNSLSIWENEKNVWNRNYIHFFVFLIF